MKNILVLFGGVSTEHMVSQRSAYNIVRGLREAGLCPRIVGLTLGGDWLPFRLDDERILAEDWEKQAREALLSAEHTPQAANENTAPAFALNLAKGASIRDFLEGLAGAPLDLVFPAVHGINCEDGVLQGLLELSGLPYVGSGVLASAVSMNKIMTKKILAHAGIPQARFVESSREAVWNDLDGELAFIAEELAFPCFVKPSNGGSSVGTAKACDEDELRAALRLAARYDAQILVEEYIPARELEVAVLGNRAPFAAAVGEVAVRAEGAYYDYETKYLSDDGARVSVPAPDLSEEESSEIRELAIEVYRKLGCRGLARVDFFKNKQNGKLYFNEINNLPGFTAISLYPQAFAYEGIALPELLLRLCHLAVEEKKDAARLLAVEPASAEE